MNATRSSDPAERTKAILKKVRQVEIKSRRYVTDAMVGAYHSVFKGQGIDFEEVREYQHGDDVRNIDWNVTAKMDKPFVKIFKEERELTIMLAVDLSASGDFGSGGQSKRELAAELACVLAFSATRNQDKVGLILFTDKIEKFIPPNKGRRHILRVIREILFYEPENKGTNIPLALRHLNRILHRHAIVFLLSDFLTDDTLAWIRPDSSGQGSLRRAIALTRKRHDLICIEMNDAREAELPDIGIVILEDSETGEQIELDTGNRKLREMYAYQNQRRREDFQQALAQIGVDILSITTDQPYVTALKQFFQKRIQRRR